MVIQDVRINPSLLRCGCLTFRHAEVRCFQLGIAGSRFQSSYSKLPNCSQWRCKCVDVFLMFFFGGLSSMKNVLHRSNSIDCKAIPQTKTARTVPSRYRRLCAIEHKRHTRTRRGADPKAARKAAEALSRLLHQRSFVRDGLGNFMVILSSAWANLPPQQVAAALLAALRRHPGHADMQFYGCRALHHLCECFPALPAMLRSDASVLTSVRAAAAVRPFCRWQAGLEKRDWYTHELCMWLQPCLLCGWWALIFAQVTS